jgi:hypothetical protein
MAKAITGPYGQELTELQTEAARYTAELQSVEAGIRAAVEARDLARLIELRAMRGAIPEIITAIQKQQAELNRLRLDEINRQAVEAHEAAFAELPTHEYVTNPNDPNAKALIVRAKMGG